MQHLVRFLAPNGQIFHGDAILDNVPDRDPARATHAWVIEGDIFGPYRVNKHRKEAIRVLLSPLSRDQIQSVRCLGLNYARHAAESGMKLPQYPILFTKPATAIGAPLDPIPVPTVAQTPGLDYECELAVVMGRPALNVSEEEALDYVLGYAVANDVSQREWQLQRGGGQWCFSKGFDGWAPLGPALAAPATVIADPQALRIWTKLNGRVVQDSSTSDMVFGVRQTIAFLSQGSTLLPGDVILTGTPSGVGMGAKPPRWLRDGDVVEVGVDKVGTCTNTVRFEKAIQPKM